MNVVATEVGAVRAGSRSGVDESALHPALPETLEYWGDKQNGDSGFRYLTALRQNSPDTKSWG